MKSILVAVDTSRRAPHVVDAASEIAHKFGATLRLLRVIELPPDIPPAGATHGDPVPSQVAQNVIQELNDLAMRTTGVMIGPPLVSFGRAWREIIDAAAKHDVDLIVVGSHGYHGWDRVLGTTAARVANLADRDVLVVHERKRAT